MLYNQLSNISTTDAQVLHCHNWWRCIHIVITDVEVFLSSQLMLIDCPMKLWNNIHRVSLSNQVFKVKLLKSNRRDSTEISNGSAQPWCGTFRFCKLFTRFLPQVTPCLAVPQASLNIINVIEHSANGPTDIFFYFNGYFMAIRTINDINNSDDRKWKNIFGYQRWGTTGNYTQK